MNISACIDMMFSYCDFYERFVEVKNCGINISEENLKFALANPFFPARLEIISKKPLVLRIIFTLVKTLPIAKNLLLEVRFVSVMIFIR